MYYKYDRGAAALQENGFMTETGRKVGEVFFKKPYILNSLGSRFTYPSLAGNNPAES